MRFLRILSAALGTALAAAAQTNTTNTGVPETDSDAAQTNAAGQLYTAVAQTNVAAQVRQLSLQDCIQMALEHNLDIRIVRYNPQIALSSLNIAVAGYDPTFAISGRHNFSLSGGGIDPNTKLPLPSSTSDANNFNSSLAGLLPSGLTYTLSGNIGESYGSVANNNFDNTRGQVGITLAQPLLRNFWIDATRLNIAIAKIDLKSTEQQLRGQILDTVNAVEQAYYTLIAARENVRVQREALRLAEELLNEDRKRVDVGQLAPLSQTQDEAQVASVRAALIAAIQAADVDQNILKVLIGDDFRTLSEVDIQPVESLAAPVQIFDLQESWRQALTDRPDIVQTKLTLEQNGIQLKYSRNQLFPQLDLVGSYGHAAGTAATREFSQGLDEFRQGNLPFYSYGAQMSIPLSNKAARDRYKQNKLVIEQNLLTLKKLEQTIMTTIANDITLARANYLQVEATREASKYALAALEAEQKKLENGKSTSYTVLQMQRDLTSARADEIRALATYNRALSQLAHDQAATFERRGINLQIK